MSLHPLPLISFGEISQTFTVNGPTYSAAAPTLPEALRLAARYEELAALPCVGGVRLKHTPDESAVLAAASAMPYGALVHVPILAPSGPQEVTLVRVAAYLLDLGRVLREYGDHSADLSDLTALRADLAAVRRVFGCTEGAK